MKLCSHTVEIVVRDPNRDDFPVVSTMRAASDAAVETVLNADVNSSDGRSEWLWIRLPNGDLVLGVYPQGDTYFEFEGEYP